ncbi:hypothetical protein [Methylocapsa acidiphila]|uniref:hypothetical protein n=1 Tax=Methylocapsa acidiphila TaxID=133552 RepID=UPI0018DDB4C4|nr:hypothetical protein [Methylocapsa acidiphila]
MKSRAVIKLLPLGQIGGNAGEARTAEEIFEPFHLRLAAPHAGFQQVADIGGHAQARLGRRDAEPFGDILAQRDGEVFHDTDIV